MNPVLAKANDLAVQHRWKCCRVVRLILGLGPLASV